jgi:hypothetical protein
MARLTLILLSTLWWAAVVAVVETPHSEVVSGAVVVAVLVAI